MESTSAFSFVDSAAYRDFFSSNKATDLVRLRLKDFKGLPFDKDLALIQLECRKKAASKIPELAEKIAFPTNVSIEQCTSEILAKFHAGLFAEGNSIVDLTCGLGIDSYYFSQIAKNVTAIEFHKIVADAAQFNFKRLGRTNIDVIHDSAEHFTEQLDFRYHAMFIDPSRRLNSDRTKRTYSILDTTPDLTTIIPQIEGKCRFLIVKASPMFDITQTIRLFPRISDVWILSIKNECKELLFKIDFEEMIGRPPIIHTINYEQTHIQQFSYGYGEQADTATYRPPLADDFMYIPNSSVMKAGAYSIVAQAFNLYQISGNSHLLLSESDSYSSTFPGSIRPILKVLSFSKADLRILHQIVSAANISCRNFPLSPEELRKRLKIPDGGIYHIYATTLANGKKVLILCGKQR